MSPGIDWETLPFDATGVLKWAPTKFATIIKQSWSSDISADRTVTSTGKLSNIMIIIFLRDKSVDERRSAR